jgi:hypothetical protein
LAREQSFYALIEQSLFGLACNGACGAKSTFMNPRLSSFPQ